MSSYKEQQEKRYTFVLIKNGDVIGTFGNLRKITKYFAEEKFPSYWTLIRKKENPIELKDYKIFHVKHY